MLNSSAENWTSRLACRLSPQHAGVLLLVGCAGLGNAFAQTANGEPAGTSASTLGVSLTQLSLRELSQVEVTSVSRKEEALHEAASAIYVLTNEDLKRSGAVSIPEALRMVPGLNVARINANKWAISSRGFNGRFANKLLVLIDGRSVYTPIYSGVYWDAQDTLLEDVDRIEVIRGPGATVWGANAVNGVINIITRRARETQGLLITGGGGNEEQGFGALRYGGRLSEKLHYRVYARGFNRDDFVSSSGRDASDEWWYGRGGFRLDWEPTPADIVTLQGDYYYGRANDQLLLATTNAPYFGLFQESARSRGANALGRWQRQLSDRSSTLLQFYFDRADRQTLYLDAEQHTYDLDFQHQIETSDWNEIIWGLGYRLIRDDIGGTFGATYDPVRRSDQLFSTYLQDEITLVPDRLRLTLGSKFEHNDYSGFEWQPGARLAWTPGKRQTFWAAISRAVRTPSRFEHTSTANVVAPAAPAVRTLVSPNRSFDSEKLLSYEIGYRVQPVERVALDAAVFINDYEDLRSSERGLAMLGTPVVVPITYANKIRGETCGGELSAHVRLTDQWRVSAGYSLLRMDLRRESDSKDSAFEGMEDDSPQNQFHLRSFLDLTHGLQLDSAVYFVDALQNQGVASYLRWDVRLGWQVTQSLEAQIVVQNILDDRHAEFGASTLVTPSEIQRSIFGSLTWRF
jgi:iron complex outermembrane receptor protein